MITPRLLEKYRKEIVPEMMKSFKYSNAMEVPQLSKVVINVGLGEAVQDVKFLEATVSEIAMMTGQSRLALQHMRDLVAGLPPEFMQEFGGVAETWLAMPLETMVRFGHWDDVLAEPALPFPPRDPHLPNDANARAGMRGHAGFGTDPAGLRACLERWVASGAPLRMAVDAARGADGSLWGLGLQRALTGPGRFGTLLDGCREKGVHVIEWPTDRLSPPVPDGPPGPPSAFWYHLGFTGPALFFRPSDGLCVAVLAHRVGPAGELLDAAQLQARRMEALAGVGRTFSPSN